MAAVIVALGVAGCGDLGTTTGAGGGGTETSDGDGGSTAGINTPVRDGKFEFTVKKVECGATKVGTGFMRTKAQGEFCLVSLKVENIGNESQTMFGDDQLLFDAKGREFSADTEAAFSLGEESQTLWEEINPGNSINGVIVFDVPRGTEPVSLELHDSMFSDGVTVSLG